MTFCKVLLWGFVGTCLFIGLLGLLLVAGLHYTDDSSED